MKCPICKREVAFGEPFMPFCSERCKLIDLGNWLDERYVISSPLSSGPPAEAEDEEHRQRSESQ